MIEKLLTYDHELFLYLNNLGSEPWDGLWQFITHEFTFVPLYALLLYLVYKKFGGKSTIIVLICAALMITLTDQFSYYCKHYFQRPRPCREDEIASLMRFVVERCGRYGYFSGHAISSMATAVFMGLLLKKSYYYLPFLLLFWAFLVGYSRIYVGVHYPLDVLTGMFFGAWIGWMFHRIQCLLRKRFVKVS